MNKAYWFDSGELYGFKNMAIDEALLNYAIQENISLILRFYGWSNPTVSFGHFQRIKDLRSFLKSQFPTAKTQVYDLLRRPTGGGWVWHEKDFTFSLILSTKTMPIGHDYEKSYTLIHKIILKSLNQIGLSAQLYEPSEGKRSFDEAVCFKYPVKADVMIKDEKILGGAQLRRRGFLLYQGTLKLNHGMKVSELIKGVGESISQYFEIRIQRFEKIEMKIAPNLEALYKKYQSRQWTGKY